MAIIVLNFSAKARKLKLCLLKFACICQEERLKFPAAFPQKKAFVRKENKRIILSERRTLWKIVAETYRSTRPSEESEENNAKC